MKKIIISNILFLILVSVVPMGCTATKPQNRHSIEQKEKKRKHHRTREERYEDKLVKKAVKKKERDEARRERQYKRNKKKYAKKVSGGGTELVDGKKVHKRMKRSKREAEKNSSRKKPFWKRIFKKKNEYK
ncbi:MAG: hypothetical protein U9N51_09255 [Bacteroidota bacterium]|nr:hypothetical protein [Bacteroidota bacterium]